VKPRGGAALRASIAVLFLAAMGCASTAPSAEQPEPSERPEAERDEGPRMKAHLIDIGQGAATLFELPCGTVLVDTGGETHDGFDSGRALEAYLDDFFSARPQLGGTIDLLVVTHAHKDHALNAEMVTGKYAVKNVVTNGFVKKPNGNYFSGGREQERLETWAKASAHLEIVEEGAVPAGGLSSRAIDPLACPGADPELGVLWGHVAERPAGWSEDAFEEANNHSVALRIGFGRASFLVTGDLEVEAIPLLIAKHRASRVLDIDVWQVSHHGSKNGASAALLDAMTPQIALLGTGRFDREKMWTAWAYGHPNKTVVDLLASRIERKRPKTLVQVGTKAKTFEPYEVSRAIYATGWDGNVVVEASWSGAYRPLTKQ
jgi:competence protein ComEC